MTWTQQSPTAGSWGETLPVAAFNFVSGSPYGLLLVLTRPYTETVYPSSTFTQSSPVAGSWTQQSPI